MTASFPCNNVPAAVFPVFVGGKKKLNKLIQVLHFRLFASDLQVDSTFSSAPAFLLLFFLPPEDLPGRRRPAVVLAD